MPVCPQCKEGDARYGHNFKNEQMLKTHIKFKHTGSHAGDTPTPAVPAAPKAPPAPVPVENGDPTLEDLGLTTPPTKQPAQPEPAAQIFTCSECGAEVQGTPDKCPNCGDTFDIDDEDDDGDGN